MAAPCRILFINGSYRDDGVTDRTVAVMIEAAGAAGAEIDSVRLRDVPIEFCRNCRACTQTPGSAPGQCVIDDRMHDLVERIERADAYVLASPTNLGSVTAVFKRFMERLVVYAYWPWGQAAPRRRKSGFRSKPAVVVASSAAPGFLGRWMFGTLRQLDATARAIGARRVGCVFTGFAATAPGQSIPARTERRARALAVKLAG